MSERDQILGRVKDALSPLRKRAALPECDSGPRRRAPRCLPGRDLLAVFSERMQLVNGQGHDRRRPAYRLPAGQPVAHSATATRRSGPRLAAHFGSRTSQSRRSSIAAAWTTMPLASPAPRGAVAETGTIILDDRSTSSRLAALAPWVHVAVLRRGEILADLAQAVAAFGDDPNVIWCTGSSSTADVEGILIRGVHGPGVQIALVLD